MVEWHVLRRAASWLGTLGLRSPVPLGPAGTGATLAGVFVIVLAAVLGWRILSATPEIDTAPRVVEVPPGLGVMGVARHLHEAGVIRTPTGLALLAVARGTARSLRAGEYEIPRGANALAVLRLLEGGKVLQHAVLLREGGTLPELARALEAERLASADAVLRAAQDAAFLEAMGISGNSAEGYLFPDTYQFVRGMPPKDILARMVTRMREQLTPALVAAARERGLSVHQLLTLASIIEREAVERAEMPIISGVFWNRLKLDMPLQADPTVQYAVGKEGRAVSRADLEVDSPFNTYRRVGLPPGPIANPGRAAIEAAVAPAAVPYLYFVAVDGRRHHFSRTLSEHNAAVARYRVARGQ